MTKTYLALLLGFALLGGCDGCNHNKNSRFSFAPEAGGAAALPWQPWSMTAAAEASEAQKPLLLSVTDPLCYWCAILDRTTLSHERVTELLADKFVLVRIDNERQPHVAARLEDGLPTVTALQPEGNQVWVTGFLQPSTFNQGLYQVLRDEMPTVMPAGRRRFNPLRAIPTDETLTQYTHSLASTFEYMARGYAGENRSLALADLRFDLMSGAVIDPQGGQQRVLVQLGSIMQTLRDPAGGFATASFNATWLATNPVKYAHEQAEMAALIMRLSRSPWAEQHTDLPTYVTAAERAVAWLEDRLWKGGKLLPGELGTPEDYAAGKRPPAPAVMPKIRTDMGGATAAALAEAGRLGGRPAWVDLAAKIADSLLASRTPEKLFWHLPTENAVPNELGDAAAMLDAAVSLYEATGEERWATTAREIALALEELSAPEGYFIDTTSAADTWFPPEPLPAANIRAASALWRLGNLTATEDYRGRARLVVMAFAGSPNILGASKGDFYLLMYRMLGPTGRLELPETWRSQPDAAALVRHPSPRVYVSFSQRQTARLCENGTCSAEFEAPADAAQALAGYLKTLEIPRAAGTE